MSVLVLLNVKYCLNVYGVSSVGEKLHICNGNANFLSSFLTLTESLCGFLGAEQSLA